MDATLEFCENKIRLSDFRHRIEDESSGNPYNCSFEIWVTSGLFSGVADGCELDYKELKKFIEQLKSLVFGKTKEAVLQEIGYGSELRFVGDGLGHIGVSGTIYADAMSHSLTFEFMTDQTVYTSFINELERL